jgi:type IV secretion system protein VirB10
MTDATGRGHAPDVTPDLRLRPERPRVTRLSRKVLLALGCIAGIAIAGAFGYALRSRNSNQAGQELYNTENRATADGIVTLPKDYTGVPQLGPPLPGDLGRPILNAQNQGRPIPVPSSMPAPGVDPEEQRRSQEIEAARVSKLFADTERPSTPSTSAAPPGAPSSTFALPAEAPPIDPNAVQNMQDRKLAFISGAADRRTVSSDRLADPVSRYIVQAGSVIPAALITGIRSDLPGEITAQVTEAVYDTPTGKYLLIPQGARLIGKYDSQVAFGQSRVLLVWDRIIMPDGGSIVLERQEGADAQGLSGLEDEVDNHWWELAKAAALTTLLGIGSDLGTSGSTDSDLVRALRQGAQDSLSNTGQQIIRRQLNIQPTLTIRPGFPVRVVVNRDLVLTPYRQEAKR